jgi:hypothetical protein
MRGSADLSGDVVECVLIYHVFLKGIEK